MINNVDDIAYDLYQSYCIENSTHPVFFISKENFIKDRNIWNEHEIFFTKANNLLREEKLKTLNRKL